MTSNFQRDDDVFGPSRFSPRLASTQDDSVYLQPQHKATQTDPLPDGLQLALEDMLSKPEEILRKMQMLMHNEHFFNIFEHTKVGLLEKMCSYFFSRKSSY